MPRLQIYLETCLLGCYWFIDTIILAPSRDCQLQRFGFARPTEMLGGSSGKKGSIPSEQSQFSQHRQQTFFRAFNLKCYA